MRLGKDNREGMAVSLRSVRKNWDLYLLILPVVAYFIVLKYLPMYGLQIAFRNYSGSKGIWGSTWVGLDHFRRFFNNYQFWPLMGNTLGISLSVLAFAFPMPILFAILLNEARQGKFKRMVQSVTFAPHFLSTTVVIGMVSALLSPSTGLVNHMIKALGGKPIYFMTEPGMFRGIYVVTEIWQHMGFHSVIYIAALSGIDVQLYEAATIDGANKWQRLAHVTIPCIVPTIIIMLIRQMGMVMDVGFEKVYLMQNDLNYAASNIIATYVYKTGLLGSEFSFSSAVGLFNSLINFSLILLVNQLARRLSETSLW